GLGVRVDRVVISTLAEETYHARLHLERDGQIFEIDSRPSDALALAVRTGGRIFASELVLEQAALGAENGGEEDSTEIDPEGAPLESNRQRTVRSARRRFRALR